MSSPPSAMPAAAPASDRALTRAIALMSLAAFGLGCLLFAGTVHRTEALLGERGLAAGGGVVAGAGVLDRLPDRAAPSVARLPN